MMRVGIILGALALAMAPPLAAARLTSADDQAAGAPLPFRTMGRVSAGPGGETRQWPGTMFETAFRGSAALFRIGAGPVRLHVRVDDVPVDDLVKPAPALFRVDGLGAGVHRLRVEVASESVKAPTTFGGFFAAPGTLPAALASSARQIEFVGDSHTVGYGNTSPKRDCTEDEVWATTDTSRAFGPMLAQRYRADYEVNAISGRGIVRNYNGFAADTLPQAYPFTLFDKAARANEPGWHPQVIVMALGTNDFTTPLHAGERWPDRAALHADFEQSYVDFVHGLRARNPHAFLVLWATDMADGEIEAEVGKVVARLRAEGEKRLAFVPVNGLAFSACNAHPSLADETVIADRLAAAIDRVPNVWRP
jgi:lysophospholipase L1-like esterase